MIGRPEKRILLVIGAALVVLVLLLTYYNSAAQSRERTINLSIIVDSPSDYLRKGMEKAANDYNVDTRLISTVGNQTSAVLTELDNNADAILISAKYPDEMQTFLSGEEIIMPMVTLDTSLQHSAIAAHIAADEQRLMEALANAIGERAGGMPCIIIMPDHATIQAWRRGNLLKDIMDAKGVSCSIIDSYADTVSRNIEGLPTGAIVCIDPAMLQQVCEQARGDDIVFGIGYNNGARQYLENGKIGALAIYSEYDMGYLGVQAAAQAVKGELAANTDLPIYIVDGGNMYEPPIDQVLFPIE